MSEAPAIILQRHRMRSDWEIVSRIESELQRAIDNQMPQINRSERNWKAYTGLHGGPWSEPDKAQLSREGREAAVFGMGRPKVDTLTGSLISEIYDLDWVPTQGTRTSSTEAIKDTYFIDKELFDYKTNISKTLRDGSVMRGECKIEVTRKIGGLPRIRIVHKNPTFIIRDPYWITEDDADCQSLWDIYHLGATELKNIFKARGAVIEQALEMQRRMGGDWSATDDVFDQIEKEMKGHLYRVIEHHWMEDVSITRAFGRKLEDETGKWYPFPITEDEEKLELFMVANEIDPLSVVEAPYTDKIHNVTTVCPSLLTDALLENGRSETQVGPRLPYYHFSNARINGEDLGVIDTIFYALQHIDKREAKITDLISTEQGATIGNEDAIPGVTAKKEAEGKLADPSAIIWARGDEMRKGTVFQTAKSRQFPSTVVNQLERMYDVIDRISGVPAAMEGMTESASEPGVVFDRKLQVSRIALLLITQQVKQLNNHLAEGYFYQWQKSYNGPPLKFVSRDGKRQVTLNERVSKGDKIYVRNVPALAPRCSVYVTESEQSLSRQSSNRMLYSGMYKDMAANHPEYATILAAAIMETFPLNDKLKAELERVGTLQKVRDMSKIKADIANLDASTQMAILNIAQAQMGLQEIAGQDIPVDEFEESEVNPEALPAQTGEGQGGALPPPEKPLPEPVQGPLPTV